VPLASSLAPIERPRQLSLAEQVRQRLTESMAAGLLAPDQPLVIDQLAVSLGVSKTPVREALGTLLRDGLIRQTDSGFRVAPLDAEYVREVYAVRSALESLAVEVVASALSEADLHELERSASVTDPRDSDFHDLIRARCPWPYLDSLIGTIQIHRARMRTLEVQASAQSQSPAREEHLAILAALQKRDGRRARGVMQAHLDRLCDQLVELARGDAWRDGVLTA
jgi:DNA-binding GntR family transcriptional regulator